MIKKINLIPHCVYCIDLQRKDSNFCLVSEDGLLNGEILLIIQRRGEEIIINNRDKSRAWGKEISMKNANNIINFKYNGICVELWNDAEAVAYQSYNEICFKYTSHLITKNTALSENLSLDFVTPSQAKLDISLHAMIESHASLNNLNNN